MFNITLSFETQEQLDAFLDTLPEDITIVDGELTEDANKDLTEDNEVLVSAEATSGPAPVDPEEVPEEVSEEV